MGLTYGRSYSTNPDQVVKFAGAVGKAYDESGLWYSYKHFPGIGKTDVDLHADTSVVPVSKDALLAEDTKVFVDLIKQSKPNTYMIMVSHAMYPQIDLIIRLAYPRKSSLIGFVKIWAITALS